MKEQIGPVCDPRETDSLIRMVFDHVGLNYLDAFRYPDKPCQPEIIPQINEIVTEITNNKPIQYILGYTIFYELKIHVSKHVLIPRPETELMVDMVIRNMNRLHPAILDIGTGSGCIAIALKKHLPGARITAIDRYADALSVAERNAGLHHADIRFVELDFLRNPEAELTGRFDLIISNPPYVTHYEKKFMQGNVLDHEPPAALFVEDTDPLIFYRAIAGYAREHLKKAGDLWLEINEKFGPEMLDLFTGFGFSDCRILKDLQEKDRFIHAKK